MAHSNGVISTKFNTGNIYIGVGRISNKHDLEYYTLRLVTVEHLYLC